MVIKHKQWSFVTFVLVSVLTSSQFANGQVVINEVCSFNGSILQDEDGSESDWIELYNQGTTPAILYNFSLEAGNSGPWYFPQVTLQPHEYLVVFASGKNRTTPNLHSHFKLSKEGETLRFYNNAGALEDMVILPILHLDHSYGKKPDGNFGTQGIFEIPTPGQSNQNSSQFTGYAPDPVFSLPAGMYNGSQLVEITGSNNYDIHFTVDGNLPHITSQHYTDPITIHSSIVIRARSFSNQNTELPSRIVTNTYILNYNQTLPVFSITTNPDDLWDWNTGIYVDGPNASPVYPHYGANYWENWEIPAHVEFFEEDGSLKFSQSVGVQIHGGTSSRTKAMKSLRLSNKSKYGGGEFHHRFFEQKPIDTFKFIVLRNSSGDFNKTHFRDGTLHKLMIGNTNIDLMAYRPSVVFLNGIYHGVHNIREKISKHYIEENYEIDGDQIDLLEEDSLVLEGDFNDFNSMYAFVTGNNMMDQNQFEAAAKMIDTESLCDYYIAETFLSNIDWPYNNLKFWKHRAVGAKWRYILVDLDIALGNNGWAPASFDVLGRIMGVYGDSNRHVHIFRSLLNNRGFREHFINRYADLVNTLFTPENMARNILETREILFDEMPLHFNKWGNDMAGWDHEIFQVAMPHVFDRPDFAMKQVRDVFGLSDIVTIELEVWPPGAGEISINTITPGPLPWKGDYFNGNPITVKAYPKSGFTFVRWVSENIFPDDLHNPEFHVNPVSHNRFTAFFSTTKNPSQLMVYPNPVKEELNFGCVLNHQGKGRVEIINATGQLVLVHDAVELFSGLNKLRLDVSGLSSGVYMLLLKTTEGVKSGRVMII